MGALTPQKIAKGDAVAADLDALVANANKKSSALALEKTDKQVRPYNTIVTQLPYKQRTNFKRDYRNYLHNTCVT
jgi:hypothetical protein